MSAHRWKKTRLYRCLSSLKHWLTERKTELAYRRYLNTSCRKNVYLIGTPSHTNVGDNAIALAEYLFLESCGIPLRHIKEITEAEYETYEELIVKALRGKRRLILLHGGGNMGNQWLQEELLRRRMMERLPKHRMVIFPQTFFYTKDDAGAAECRASIPYYDGRNGLTITARETLSFELMKGCYPHADVLLTPDIVLSAAPERLGVRSGLRNGVLFVLRSDGERNLTENDADELMQVVLRSGMQYRVTDMITELPVEKEHRDVIVRQKLDEFSAAELVITDRLHAMVFAAVTGTPCVVLQNNNHKIAGTYEWIRSLPYIRLADSVMQAEELMEELRTLPLCRYDNSAFITEFDCLRARIRELI